MLVSELWVRNFKSLRDVRLRLGQFNLVVGPNGSGKTNLIDALEFFRDALTAEGVPRPWRRWWRPENIVWMRDETLPLTFGFEFGLNGFRATYEVTCSVTGGEYRIEREVLDIQGWGRLERTGSTVSVSYEEGFVEEAKKKGVESELLELREVSGILHPQESLVRGIVWGPLLMHGKKIDKDLWKVGIYSRPKGESLVLVAPTLELEKDALEEFLAGPRRPSLPLILGGRDILTFACTKAMAIVEGITIVRPLNLQVVKKPQEYVKTLRLASDCSNLYIVLYNLFLRRNRLPDRVAKVLSMAFEGYELLFDLTEDGRVFVKLVRDDLVLPPPCMPDGFHKLAAILTALELRPSILAIDELENSLHPHLVELVVDLLKSSDTVVIATTHSPAVVDIADPEDLILANMTSSGTVFRRLKDPVKIREELKRYGITLSERWLWGRVEVE